MRIESIHVHTVALPVAGGAYRMSHTTVEALESTHESLTWLVDHGELDLPRPHGR